MPAKKPTARRRTRNPSGSRAEILGRIKFITDTLAEMDERLAHREALLANGARGTWAKELRSAMRADDKHAAMLHAKRDELRASLR